MKRHYEIIDVIRTVLDCPRTSLGKEDDRGCVACGTIYTADWYTQHGAKAQLLVDVRGRYWCLECAGQALAREGAQ